jgi:oxygen-independent coproporphyrinogen-3 oxidase
VLGLYVHVPFCRSICNYCNFNRGLFDAALKDRYLAGLHQEIAAAADGTPADTVFFGGGTPSLLTPSEIEAVLARLRQSFALSRDAEVTLEANPETVTSDSLAGYRAAGVNRLSYGVQSFRDDDLVRLGRAHTARRAEVALADARAAGFTNVSLDLMMWLPQQSIPQWLESVEHLIELRPEHASLYLLEVYPNAPLRDAMARAQWSLVPDDDAADMYLAAMERLEGAGYEQYEISNVTRPGAASRHNLKYWTGESWIGFGSGAHSTRDGTRWKNRSSTEEYISAVAATGHARVEERVLTSGERLEERLFMGLRLTRGVNLEEIRASYGVDIWTCHREELEPFRSEGLLIYDSTFLRLTPAGMLLANEIMRVFISPTVR